MFNNSRASATAAALPNLSLAAWRTVRPLCPTQRNLIRTVWPITSIVGLLSAIESPSFRSARFAATNIWAQSEPKPLGSPSSGSFSAFRGGPRIEEIGTAVASCEVFPDDSLPGELDLEAMGPLARRVNRRSNRPRHLSVWEAVPKHLKPSRAVGSAGTNRSDGLAVPRAN